MNEENVHKTPLSEPEKLLFGKGKISWEKSQDEVWEELQQKMTKKPDGEVVPLSHRIMQWSAAAVLLVLVGLMVLVSSYTKEVECLPGEHQFVQLPDGSGVELNAASKLTYYPFRWRFERKLKLEGEAYFNVKKGRKFYVVSAKGTTTVMGTSFNIYARNDDYRVTCLTGKVLVTSGKKQRVELLPNNHAELEKGTLVVKKMFEPEKAVGWKNNRFFFANRPLQEVIDEIERQYAVTIQLAPGLDNRNFGSNFSKQHSVEEVLDFVCKPMNLKFVKQSENVYLVVEKS